MAPPLSRQHGIWHGHPCALLVSTISAASPYPLRSVCSHLFINLILHLVFSSQMATSGCFHASLFLCFMFTSTLRAKVRLALPPSQPPRQKGDSDLGLQDTGLPTGTPRLQHGWLVHHPETIHASFFYEGNGGGGGGSILRGSSFWLNQSSLGRGSSSPAVPPQRLLGHMGAFPVFPLPSGHPVACFLCAFLRCSSLATVRVPEGLQNMEQAGDTFPGQCQTGSLPG